MSEPAPDTLRRHLEVLQDSLPLTSRPFAGYAEKLGITEHEVIGLLRHYLETGVIRRVAGVLKHDRAGFSRNAMVALEIDPGSCDDAAAVLTKFPFITHLYRRTSYPDWPYTMYAMVHARTPGEFEARLSQLRASVAHRSMAVLRSVKEYKKTAFRMGEQ